MKHLGLFFLLIAGTVGTGAALADDDSFSATDPVWKAECGSCHLAFPPELLPASSWRTMMGGLDRHFGADASLDPATAAKITAFLEKNASRKGKLASEKTLRITETRWFMHEHDEVPARIWKSEKVKGASNCVACHVNAERGDYSEHSVRVPR
jgi:hypothetical protein